MPSYFSFAEQTAHYFSRPHTRIPRQALDSPAAWRGRELRKNSLWRKRLSSSEIEEIEEALGRARASGKHLEALVAEDFPLPTLASEIARWRAEIGHGRGFQVVSGVPIQRWSRTDAELFFWCLGLHMGRPGAQNPQGDLLGFVEDTEEDALDPHVRLYRTRRHIEYHCDAADVVALLCVRAAAAGGTSHIVSSVSVFNELLKRRPDLMPRLFEDFALDIRNEDRSLSRTHLPIPPCRHGEGHLRTFYHSDYFRSARRHEDVPAFTPEEESLLDLYEEIALDPDLRLDMTLEPGDMQWISNHSILHARDGYEDPPDPDQKRLLLRLWLSLETQF